MFAISAANSLMAADFTVTTPNDQFAFNINGVSPNPDITLVRGKKYTFAVDTSGFHPFAFSYQQNGAPTTETPAGVTNNNINSGTITFDVPMDATNCVYYCVVHFFMGNVIIVDPPASPRFEILGLNMGASLVVTSTGTNNWTPFPEFSTNLSGTNWYSLTVQSNRFADGTNETFCGRPPGDAVFIRIRSQAN